MQQQELFQNALYGFEMNPIEDGGQAQNQFIVNTPPMGY